jgi:hypothetical protein
MLWLTIKVIQVLIVDARFLERRHADGVPTVASGVTRDGIPLFSVHIYCPLFVLDVSAS